mmetsp:Transcript_17453/g.20916  ORF Transcript_17453/g.20916 Transcript_17453/m.20916 type:complete len:148 (-) Transcript_17453:91-534(-)|eukprot:CAMPEP_0195265706 /NCGR_PEP_ID=MMETSP0706-20130129/11589_1 /TAXON_ID=33640 /ORGANISM="Asterionellopsis glacialis, Strain CCMP134" /LENGTH=147 /DNA_ID=CAMNT_0040320187 /DNA_START=35 /DNA_END=478 /DNA_ORIENTATION=-
MKSAAVFSLLVASASAFSPANTPAFTRQQSSLNAVPLANGAMSFDQVCREWRCKYTGDKSDSESLEAIAKVVDEYLPQIKAVSDGVTVNRLVCGSCLDFKLMTTVPLDDFGPWEEKEFAPEGEFLAKIKAIEGVSQVETQTITNVQI